MTNFSSYRKTHWKPEYNCGNLREAQDLYAIVDGIGGLQHMCQDNEIALRLGLKGLLEGVRGRGRRNRGNAEFYAALEDVVLGLMNWVSRTSSEAEQAGQDGRGARGKEKPGRGGAGQPGSAGETSPDLPGGMPAVALGTVAAQDVQWQRLPGAA